MTSKVLTVSFVGQLLKQILNNLCKFLRTAGSNTQSIMYNMPEQVAFHSFLKENTWAIGTIWIKRRCTMSTRSRNWKKTCKKFQSHLSRTLRNVSFSVKRSNVYILTALIVKGHLTVKSFHRCYTALQIFSSSYCLGFCTPSVFDVNCDIL